MKPIHTLSVSHKIPYHPVLAYSLHQTGHGQFTPSENIHTDNMIVQIRYKGHDQLRTSPVINAIETKCKHGSLKLKLKRTSLCMCMCSVWTEVSWLTCFQYGGDMSSLNIKSNVIHDSGITCVLSPVMTSGSECSHTTLSYSTLVFINKLLFRMQQVWHTPNVEHLRKKLQLW